jgi:hypothetical protein
MMRRIAARAELRRRDARLDAVDRDLLAALDELAILGYGDTRIAVRKLAEKIHRTPRTVRRHLGTLEALGWLGIEERCHGHGGPAVNRYRLLTPREWTRAEVERRRSARQARDRARKAPRERRSGGGVLTRVTPALTRGRVSTRSGTGERSGVARSSRTETIKRTQKGGAMDRYRVGAAEAQARREAGERWERMAATADRMEAVQPGPERDAVAEREARDRVAELVARAQAAQARRLGIGPGAPWERGAA